MASGQAPPAELAVEYFTDPLCAWSWALEGPWRQLRAELGTRLRWRYRMGGLIADWKQYDDPVHCVSRPAQMAPHWFEVRQVCGVTLDEGIWREDPPASSYPACLACKAAERQSLRAADLLLLRLREAVMLHRRNIARWDVLQAIAEELAADMPDEFDAGRFADDLNGDEAAEAFREDLRQTRYYQIARFPTLVITPRDGRAALLVGYRPYEVLRDTLEQLVASPRTPVRRPGS